MTTNYIDPASGKVTTGTGKAPTTSTAQQSNGTNNLANEQTFLKLLVAQLKNQDPEQPQDGTQFVAQLAQFSTLEQTLQTRQDADTIVKILQTPATATKSSAGTGSDSKS